MEFLNPQILEVGGTKEKKSPSYSYRGERSAAVSDRETHTSRATVELTRKSSCAPLSARMKNFRNAKDSSFLTLRPRTWASPPFVWFNRETSVVSQLLRKQSRWRRDAARARAPWDVVLYRFPREWTIYSEIAL